jgi:hypothetical protein
MILKEVNGIEIINKEIINKNNLLNHNQLSGYFTRECYVLVKYLDESQNQIYTNFMTNKYVNQILLSYFDSDLLENNRKKIEEPIDYIKNIGKELIKDYNYQYYNYTLYPIDLYFNTPKMCLIRLEQLFILNDWPTWYIFEFVKPNLRKNCENIFNMIKLITDLEISKIRKLKEYLDEYFQYVFDRPKNIYKINKLLLPIDCINEIKIEQFAAYLVRSSTVTLEYIDNYNIVSMNSIEANDSFMTWVKAIFGSDSIETQRISEFRHKIENPIESITQLENKLSLNPELRQCLIDMEQLFIRHEISTSLIDDYTNNHDCIMNFEIYEWIKKLTNLKKQKIRLLKKYLDLHFEHIIRRTTEP